MAHARRNGIRFFLSVLHRRQHDVSESAICAGRPLAAFLRALAAAERLFKLPPLLCLIRKRTPKSLVGKTDAQFVVEYKHPRGHPIEYFFIHTAKHDPSFPLFVLSLRISRVSDTLSAPALFSRRNPARRIIRRPAAPCRARRALFSPARRENAPLPHIPEPFPS